MLQQVTEEFWEKHKNLSLNLLQLRKSIISTLCTSTQRKLENEQRKSHRIIISSCWPTDIVLLDFTHNEGLVQIKVIINSHDFGLDLDYTLH